MVFVVIQHVTMLCSASRTTRKLLALYAGEEFDKHELRAVCACSLQLITWPCTDEVIAFYTQIFFSLL